MPEITRPTRAAPHALALAMTAFAFAAPPAAAGSDPTGIWLDDRGRGAVEIASCGGAMCGKVVWVKSARDAKGCGTRILGDARPVGGGRWDNGWIFSPEHGRRFDVELTPIGNDRLRVVGYMGSKLFSQARMWRRAPADLVRCDRETEAKRITPKGETTTPVETAKAEMGRPDVAPVSSIVAATTPGMTGAEATSVVRPADAAPKPPAAAPAEPATAASSAASAASNDSAPEDEPAPRRSRPRLSIDKVLKKTADGRCKLDLPWVRVKFDCDRF